MMLQRNSQKERKSSIPFVESFVTLFKQRKVFYDVQDAKFGKERRFHANN